MSLLEIRDLSHSFGDKILYNNVNLDIYKNEHVGVVGVNGAGKSTFIKILCGICIPDDGTIKWQSNIKLGMLDQYAEVLKDYTIYDYLKTAFKDLYDIEKKLNFLYEKMASDTSETIMKKASSYQNILEERNFYSIDTIIRKVSSGLGIDSLGFDTVLKNLSGGQRAKVILAKLLIEKPDMLLLDEPTNFLDKEHVSWLSEYLNTYKGAFIVVSHDIEFIKSIATCICDIDLKSIRKYNCGYEKYLKEKENLEDDYVRRYREQQRFIKKTEEFIAKNKVRAATAKMARGRQKQLDRVERLDSPNFNVQHPCINFKYLNASCKTSLTVKNLEVGYEKAILPKLNFKIKNGEKVVITGFNGIGKSTLLKTLIGENERISGFISFGEHIKPGYYEQDLRWDDNTLTPLEIISDMYPDMTNKEIRRYLSLCGVKNETVLQKIKSLSGGEQSKVKICELTLNPCNMLILDEITNHLDNNCKDALKESLISYEGTVILVSHEASFYRGWADRIINIEEIMQRNC